MSFIAVLKPRLLPFTCMFLALGLSGGARASGQSPPEPTTEPSVEAEVAAAIAARPGGPGAAAAQEPKPYGKVITPDAETQQGLFTVHRVKSRLYFEIPKDLLDRPLLMVANATAVPPGIDHVGKSLAQEVVRFTLRDNRVFLQAINHNYTTGQDEPNADAVQASQRDAILMAMNVAAYGKDGEPVVEVGRLFTTEVGDFTARAMLQARSLDSARSYVDSVRAFPGSLRIDAVHTYMAQAMLNTPLGPKAAPAHFPMRANSLDVAYNIVELPERPMMPRLMDDRVGYFYVDRLNFGGVVSPVRDDKLIARWRLEKKDPDAELSEPVKPIVWYIDRSTPTALVPYIKQGIEAWNVAFEAAGFRNAVQARPFPSREEDPEFDPEDVRYSIIRWVPSKVTNAYGPSLKDPRSGEILNANIVMYHNIQTLLQNWYISQAGAVDRRAQSLPLPDSLIGDLVAMVVTHEVGHSLGFQHNMKASSQYPVEKLRDPEWLRTMGHVSSIMDYSRFNYLVQPEDGIDPALLIPRVGPYDLFATRWGYAPVPGARTPEEERPVLNQWVREQDDKPWLRFSSPKSDGNDFGSLMEAVGDADAVTATELGTRNIKRIVRMLPTMTLRPGENDKDLADLFKVATSQWRTELGHVAAIVGSYDFHNKHGDQPGPVYTVTGREQQARAVSFLNEQLFQTPEWLFEPAIQERLWPGIVRTTLTGIQKSVLGSLLERKRLGYLQVQQMDMGSDAYTVADLLSDLRKGLLSEMDRGTTPDLPRRELQRAYVSLLGERVNGTEDSQPLLRAELKSLKVQFDKASRRSRDAAARAHWAALSDAADDALNPLPKAGATGGRGMSMPALTDQPEQCRYADGPPLVNW